MAKVKRQYNSVRMNETVFEALLEQQKQYSVDKSIGLLIGNKNTETALPLYPTHIAARVQGYKIKLK